MVKATVVSGYGINCEREMAEACAVAGAGTVKILHSHTLLKEKHALDDTHFLLFPGGFSFGDDLGAGKALANRMIYRSHLMKQLREFVDRGGCILGICNGFQLLVKLGLLPGEETQQVALAPNDCGHFENRWVHHQVCASSSIFTQGLQTLYLPVRHSEGKIVFKEPSLFKELQKKGQIPLRYATAGGHLADSYPDNPNGSYGAVAALTDSTGRIMGMMAHPEAAITLRQHPYWTKLKRENPSIDYEGEGIRLFQNAINYIKDHI